MIPESSPPEEPAIALVEGLVLEIEPLLSRFQLDEGETEEILREVLLLLACRWERIDSREIWLLAALRRSCLRRLRARGRTVSEH
jgi:hypothetical protein